MAASVYDAGLGALSPLQRAPLSISADPFVITAPRRGWRGAEDPTPSLPPAPDRKDPRPHIPRHRTAKTPRPQLPLTMIR